MTEPWVVDFYSDEGWEETMKDELIPDPFWESLFKLVDERATA